MLFRSRRWRRPAREKAAEESIGEQAHGGGRVSGGGGLGPGGPDLGAAGRGGEGAGWGRVEARDWKRAVAGVMWHLLIGRSEVAGRGGHVRPVRTRPAARGEEF